jgi:anti-repressor protein
MELVNSSARKILEMRKEIEEKDRVIEVQKPKVEFYDTVTKSESTFDMAEVAKLLKIPNVGSVKLFEFLREQDVLSDNKANWNEPYQNYVNAGYFKIVEAKSEDKHGNIHVNKKTVVFQKGVDFIRKLAKDSGLIKTHSVALF